MDIEKRIEVDIEKFNSSIKKFDIKKANMINEESITKVFELAKMYASDAKSWLEKKDYYTAFASISYAHGLLDAILKIMKIIE
jgi:hypothetical protein